eukprot:TRINITY_DN32024_c0_g1_i1.p1 TRINITY_DN32024_c0_g1~~TRINITY_DN32024_c0_g1_i1.p1  ORF type:complete len:116 (-),score=16.95 TRINITY_DN32024_c0_g1_i1:253-600(-)
MSNDEHLTFTFVHLPILFMDPSNSTDVHGASLGSGNLKNNAVPILSPTATMTTPIAVLGANITLNSDPRMIEYLEKKDREETKRVQEKERKYRGAFFLALGGAAMLIGVGVAALG